MAPTTTARLRLDFTKPHALRNAAEHAAAHAEMIALLDRQPAPGSEDDDRLEFLTALIVAYDAEHAHVDEIPTTPQEVVDVMLAEKGMTRAQLAGVFGSRGRVSEFFSGKRRLSITQVQKLRAVLGIPADLLIPRE